MSLFKGGIKSLKEAKKVLKIGLIVNNYQDCWRDWQKHFDTQLVIEKKGLIVFCDLGRPQGKKSSSTLDFC